MSNRSGAIPFQAPDNAPPWFHDNLQHPGDAVITSVAGSDVHMLTWNWEKTELPVLLFVHGFCGHAHWWSFLAPFFTQQYRVAALDLPGMGDSAPPKKYTENCFAEAIIGCIEQHQLQAVCIIGHSFGGAQSIRAMAIAPPLFSRGIIVDTNVSLPPNPSIRRLEPRDKHKLRATRAECLSRFRLMPPQDGNLQAAFDYVAYHSCSGDEHGWHWKFDPHCINAGELNGTDILRKVSTRVDLIYAEHSMFNTENKPTRILQNFSNAGELIIIADANHHIMLDHPLALVAAIRGLLH